MWDVGFYGSGLRVWGLGSGAQGSGFGGVRV